MEGHARHRPATSTGRSLEETCPNVQIWGVPGGAGAAAVPAGTHVGDMSMPPLFQAAGERGALRTSFAVSHRMPAGA